MTHLPEWLAETIEQRCGVTVDRVPEPVLNRYLAADVAFSRHLDAGEEPGPWIAIRRTLARYDQQTGTGTKADLDAQYHAMADHPELGPVVHDACAKTLDLDRLAGYGCDIWVGDDGASAAIQVVVEGSRDWPDELGGPGRQGEIERHFVLWVRQAPWRDRRVRRLVRVDIHNVELHADPARWLGT